MLRVLPDLEAANFNSTGEIELPFRTDPLGISPARVACTRKTRPKWAPARRHFPARSQRARNMFRALLNPRGDNLPDESCPSSKRIPRNSTLSPRPECWQAATSHLLFLRQKQRCTPIRLVDIRCGSRRGAGEHKASVLDEAPGESQCIRSRRGTGETTGGAPEGLRDWLPAAPNVSPSFLDQIGMTPRHSTRPKLRKTRNSAPGSRERPEWVPRPPSFLGRYSPWPSSQKGGHGRLQHGPAQT